MAVSIEHLTDRVAALGDLVDEILISVATTPAPGDDRDPRAAVDDRLRELMVGLEALRNAAEAVQAETLVAMTVEADALDAAELAATGGPTRSHSEFIPDELGALLACPKVTASRRLHLAVRSGEYPTLMRAWSDGAIDGRKAQVVVDEVGVLHDSEALSRLGVDEVRRIAAELSSAAVEHARTHTWPETRVWLRRRVLKVVPDVAELRRGRAEHERRVEIRPVDDGMSELWAWLPSVAARQIQQALTSAAHDLAGKDTRTMDQRRADLLVDWLLGPDHAPVVHLHVVAETDVTEDTERDTAAWLPGAGPLSELQTAELVGSSTRMVTELPVLTVSDRSWGGQRNRSGPHHSLARWTNRSDQPGSPLPTASSSEALTRVEGRPGAERSDDLDCSVRTDVPHAAVVALSRKPGHRPALMSPNAPSCGTRDADGSYHTRGRVA
jgi:hypothetical protein